MYCTHRSSAEQIFSSCVDGLKHNGGGASQLFLAIAQPLYWFISNKRLTSIDLYRDACKALQKHFW